jgi:thioredoxin 1
MIKKNLFFVLAILSLFLMIAGCNRTANEKENSTFKNDSIDEQGGIKVTFIELGSVKCIPCKMMQPIMKEIEEEYPDQVKVVFYDVWTPEGRPYTSEYNIKVIPTQVFLDKDENEYYRHEGFFPKDELVKVLKKKGVK